MATSMKACLLGALCWVPICAAHAQSKDIPPPAYQLAAHEANIPSAVLYAIALQESGAMLRGRRIPWPWTLNVAGQPHRFQTRSAACAHLRSALLEVSATRIDVGLGQINVGYHAQRVARPCDLLDPYRNLSIAAVILSEQHTPGTDWLLTIGRYHRPAGGAPAARYRIGVYKHLTGVLGNPVSVIAMVDEAP